MGQEKKILMICFDVMVLISSLIFFANYIQGTSGNLVLSSVGSWFIVSTLVLLLYIFGSYDISPSLSLRKILARVLIAVLISLGFVVVINYLGGKERGGIFSRAVLICSFISFAFVGSSLRIVLVFVVKKVLMDTRWLIVCSERYYSLLMENLKKDRFHGQPFFLLDQLSSSKKENAQILGTWKDLPVIIGKENLQKGKTPWKGIVLALEEKAPPEVLERLILARFESVTVKDLVEFYEENFNKIPLFALGTSWFLHSQGFSLFGNPIRLRVKRLLDIVVSAAMLVISSPIMLIVYGLIRMDSKGSPIYSQLRTGRNGIDFTLFKFRSMRLDAESSGAQWAAQDDHRITRVGKILRKTRIDELPQLVNILQGNMSLVGPRPERPEFNHMLNEKIPFYNFRHMVHPGLTGWAQVLYPYGASLEDAQEKLQYELFYIKNYSLWLDISIILKTVQVVLFGKGR